MYRARSVLNNLVPFVPSAAGPERFASWLLGSARSAGARVATSRQYNSPASAEPFLNGSSSAYVEDMYNSWLADPKSVHVVSLIQYNFTCVLLKKLPDYRPITIIGYMSEVQTLDCEYLYQLSLLTITNLNTKA